MKKRKKKQTKERNRKLTNKEKERKLKTNFFKPIWISSLTIGFESKYGVIKNKHFIVVVLVPNFLSAQSSSFLPAFFLHIHGKPF